jgi:ribonuclease P/MRP protein subunit POP5
MVRFKNRYLLCEIAMENGEIIDGLSGYAVLACINDSLTELFGDAAALLGHVQIKYYSCFTNLAIIRVSRDFHKQVWAAITMVTAIRKRNCAIRVIHVGGTIKLVQKHTLDHDAKILKKLVAASKMAGIKYFIKERKPSLYRW